MEGSRTCFLQKVFFSPWFLAVFRGNREDTKVFVFVIATFPVCGNCDIHRHRSSPHQRKPTINLLVLSELVRFTQLPPPHATPASPQCPEEPGEAFGRGQEEGKTERAQCCCVMKWQIEPARQCPGPAHDDIHFTQPLPVPAGTIGDANFDFCVWKRYCLMEVCGWRVKQAAKCQHKKQTFSFPPSPM